MAAHKLFVALFVMLAAACAAPTTSQSDVLNLEARKVAKHDLVAKHDESTAPEERVARMEKLVAVLEARKAAKHDEPKDVRACHCHMYPSEHAVARTPTLARAIHCANSRAHASLTHRARTRA